jgi:hypothetical protein
MIDVRLHAERFAITHNAYKTFHHSEDMPCCYASFYVALATGGRTQQLRVQRNVEGRKIAVMRPEKDTYLHLTISVISGPCAKLRNVTPVKGKERQAQRTSVVMHSVSHQALQYLIGIIFKDMH